MSTALPAKPIDESRAMLEQIGAVDEKACHKQHPAVLEKQCAYQRALPQAPPRSTKLQLSSRAASPKRNSLEMIGIERRP
ncbi:hypothetical protein ST47_g2761 [Ascochyta rabiei]|uniref:Uncharacterized protein n=1 Tax=Didymella rabiei TaxID=5454 RepID=A0A163J344_DIDRA|nr:hypothetical protein ST47_g2761 [Ascochyta rabiei]